MGAEQSKAAKRRFADGAFHLRYFAGHGLDVGGKPDPLGRYVGAFARLLSCRTWDLEDGDAQFLAGVPDASLDFVHSSHCLEHLRDPREGLTNWVRVVRPGGYVVVTVPDEDLYEQGGWPSRFNADHKWTFTIYKRASWSPRSVNVTDLIAGVYPHAVAERVLLVRDFFDDAPAADGRDQTQTLVAECAIEFVLRKL